MLSPLLIRLLLQQKAAPYNTLMRIKAGKPVRKATLDKVNATIQRLQQDLKTEIKQWEQFVSTQQRR